MRDEGDRQRREVVFSDARRFGDDRRGTRDDERRAGSEAWGGRSEGVRRAEARCLPRTHRGRVVEDASREGDRAPHAAGRALPSRRVFSPMRHHEKTRANCPVFARIREVAGPGRLVETARRRGNASPRVVRSCRATNDRRRDEVRAADDVGVSFETTHRSHAPRTSPCAPWSRRSPPSGRYARTPPCPRRSSSSSGRSPPGACDGPPSRPRLRPVGRRPRAERLSAVADPLAGSFAQPRRLDSHDCRTWRTYESS